MLRLAVEGIEVEAIRESIAVPRVHFGPPRISNFI